MGGPGSGRRPGGGIQSPFARMRAVMHQRTRKVGKHVSGTIVPRMKNSIRSVKLGHPAIHPYSGGQKKGGKGRKIRR